MKASACVALWLAAAVSVAAPAQQQSQSPRVLQPFEFKGVRAGDTAAMHASQWGSIVRSAPCLDGNRDNISIYSCRFADEMVSGIRLNAFATFEPAGGKLVSVEGLTDVQNFRLLRQAFTLKYGEPSAAASEPMTLGSGEQISVPHVQWLFADGRLELYIEKSRSSRGDLKLWFEYKTTAYMDQIERVRDQLTPKPKVDF